MNPRKRGPHKEIRRSRAVSDTHAMDVKRWNILSNIPLEGEELSAVSVESTIAGAGPYPPMQSAIARPYPRPKTSLQSGREHIRNVSDDHTHRSHECATVDSCMNDKRHFSNMAMENHLVASPGTDDELSDAATSGPATCSLRQNHEEGQMQRPKRSILYETRSNSSRDSLRVGLGTEDSPLHPHRHTHHDEPRLVEGVATPAASSPASEWDIERVTAWLAESGFNEEWQEAFRNERLEGQRFLDLVSYPRLRQTVPPLLVNRGGARLCNAIRRTLDKRDQHDQQRTIQPYRSTSSPPVESSEARHKYRSVTAPPASVYPLQTKRPIPVDGRLFQSAPVLATMRNSSMRSPTNLLETLNHPTGHVKSTSADSHFSGASFGSLSSGQSLFYSEGYNPIMATSSEDFNGLPPRHKPRKSHPSVRRTEAGDVNKEKYGLLKKFFSRDKEKDGYNRESTWLGKRFSTMVAEDIPTSTHRLSLIDPHELRLDIDATAPPESFKLPLTEQYPLESETPIREESAFVHRLFLARKILVQVTKDGEQFFVVNLSHYCYTPSLIREALCEKVQLTAEFYDIYLTEIGAEEPTGTELDDMALVTSTMAGDAKGTLKFFVKPKSSFSAAAQPLDETLSEETFDGRRYPPTPSYLYPADYERRGNESIATCSTPPIRSHSISPSVTIHSGGDYFSAPSPHFASHHHESESARPHEIESLLHQWQQPSSGASPVEDFDDFKASPKFYQTVRSKTEGFEVLRGSKGEESIAEFYQHPAASKSKDKGLSVSSVLPVHEPERSFQRLEAEDLRCSRRVNEGFTVLRGSRSDPVEDTKSVSAQPEQGSGKTLTRKRTKKDLKNYDLKAHRQAPLPPIACRRIDRTFNDENFDSLGGSQQKKNTRDPRYHTKFMEDQQIGGSQQKKNTRDPRYHTKFMEDQQIGVPTITHTSPTNRTARYGTPAAKKGITLQTNLPSIAKEATESSSESESSRFTTSKGGFMFKVPNYTDPSRESLSNVQRSIASIISEGERPDTEQRAEVIEPSPVSSNMSPCTTQESSQGQSALTTSDLRSRIGSSDRSLQGQSSILESSVLEGQSPFAFEGSASLIMGDESSDDEGLWAVKPVHNSPTASPFSVPCAKDVLPCPVRDRLSPVKSAMAKTPSGRKVQFRTDSPRKDAESLYGSSPEYYAGDDKHGLNSPAVHSVQSSHPSPVNANAPTRRNSFARHDDVWAVRPPAEVLYDHLEEYFPEHDLDKPIIVETDTENAAEDTVPPLPSQDVPVAVATVNRAMGRQNNRMKSMRVVAKEASEARKRFVVVAQSARFASMLRRKSTKVWGQKVMEMTPLQVKRGQVVDDDDGVKRVPTFKWVKGELIGKGTYGHVYLAMNAVTGDLLAVKQVEILQDKDRRRGTIIDGLNAEVETMKDLDHLNIVQYLGYERGDTVISIFLEYIPGGSIGRCLRKHGKFEGSVIRSLTRQTLEGLAYIHSRGILHRDLKADNILLDPDGVSKISDFGISKRSEDIYGNDANMSMKGTIFWMAPEVIQNQRQGYSAKIDIWSLGCVVLEMFAGRRPWSNDEAVGAMFKLGKERLAPPIPDDVKTDLLPAAQDFLQLCFTIDPAQRPTAEELLKHPFCGVDPNFNFFDSQLAKVLEQRKSFK
ncbi:MAP kinase kinase kinase mkh1 [Neolecta irregularis DAH-3]|uniref:MAP kinase kinase kinase mkh1 n=1 Tax=Neolecta irregularis (strain DAH-3) TaxID=1198029 RepID=A0A1U7LMK1_NEOID|nr:MAP kinase kinase kinase mkh1 [Neolecta irregularis DAH-3]|eukprot:OLL23869.1 MAP kinase kinase kinase mkh1 [Neolecta irregularis DAH-3]